MLVGINFFVSFIQIVEGRRIRKAKRQNPKITLKWQECVVSKQGKCQGIIWF